MNEQDVGAMVEDYLAQTGIKDLPDGMECEANSKGFMRYCISGDEMFIPDVYGDGRYWLRRAKEIAQENGVSKLSGVARTTKIEAYKRLFGGKVTGYIFEVEVE